MLFAIAHARIPGMDQMLESMGLCDGFCDAPAMDQKQNL